jgi:DNA-binding CsgD family transcriptional regulator
VRYQRYLDISQSSDLPTFRQRLVDFAGDLGFGLVSAFVIAEFPDKSRSFTMIHNAPDGFAESATRNGEDAARDPVLQRLKKYSVPFVYDQSVYVNAGAGDLWEEQAPFGYKTGIAVSLHIPGSKQFMLGFDREDPLPTRDEELTRMLADLQLVAVHAQDAAARLLLPPAPDAAKPSLTKRELEILKWTAAGKTAGETAQILCISTHTVTYHVRTILEKLNATNKHKAVLNAIALGLI